MSFRTIDRDTDYLLSPFGTGVAARGPLGARRGGRVEGLDLSELERAYAGRGGDAYPPALLLSLLIYGYATGVHSSRKIERATYDSPVFRCPRPASGLRYAGDVPPPFWRAICRCLRASATSGPREPAFVLWHGRSGRHQDSRQREPAQRALPWACREDRSPTQGQSAGSASAGRGSRSA